MNSIQTFEKFLAFSNVDIPIVLFAANLIATAILSYILSLIYSKYGLSLSNKIHFSKNFVMISMTTMIIITVVKSSLALSLGLVGALSIIRFRAAIKEPEELSFLFLCIAIGLGFGANQGLITILGFIITIVTVLFTRRYLNSYTVTEFVNIIISSKTNILNSSVIINILKDHCDYVTLKRLDESGTNIETALTVNFNTYNDLDNVKTALREIDSDVKISYIENDVV